MTASGLIICCARVVAVSLTGARKQMLAVLGRLAAQMGSPKAADEGHAAIRSDVT